MRIEKFIQMYKEGSVCVCGLVGRGKDMLMANVVVRRGIPYVGNTNYCSDLYIPFNYKDIDCGGNTYDDFINGTLKYYEYPFPDGTDIYLGDLGVYFPSQYCSELNHKYKNIPTFLALSRQLGKAHVHFNVQNLNRAWDKVREMSEKYVWCSWCKVFFGKWVLQKVIIYERYQSCVDRVPPYFVPFPLFNQDRQLRWRIDKQNYIIAHGVIKPKILFYRNKSDYDTRVFKEMLKNGRKE